nr:hypothetical protein Iba_chr02eCG4150 [Ipomoea batatas]
MTIGNELGATHKVPSAITDLHTRTRFEVPVLANHHPSQSSECRSPKTSSKLDLDEVGRSPLADSGRQLSPEGRKVVQASSGMRCDVTVMVTGRPTCLEGRHMSDNNRLWNRSEETRKRSLILGDQWLRAREYFDGEGRKQNMPGVNLADHHTV